MNATATIVSRIARVSLGLVVAGVVLGQTGTAFADAPAADVATTPAAYSQAMYPGDADPGMDAPPAAESDRVTDPAAESPTPPASELTLSSPTTTTVVSGEVSCTRLTDTAYTWELTSEVDGVPLNLTFNTAHYRGAASYRTTGVTDEQGGLLALAADPVQVATNGLSAGAFIVDEGEATGSVDADLDDAATGQRVHVSGTWTCS